MTARAAIHLTCSQRCWLFAPASRVVYMNKEQSLSSSGRAGCGLFNIWRWFINNGERSAKRRFRLSSCHHQAHDWQFGLDGSC